MTAAASGAIATAEPLVVVRVEDAIDPTLAGRAGASYQSPPQPCEQALALVRLLLGCASAPLNGDARWVAPIVGGQRTVTLRPAPGINPPTNRREPTPEYTAAGRPRLRCEDEENG
jgi:hypothetical protein